MAALTAERITREFAGNLLALEVAAGSTIYAGAMVGIDGGKAVPASATVKAVGVAQNTAEAGKTVTVKSGVFAVENDDAAQAQVGTRVFVKDDQTVTKTGTAGTTAEAGTLLGFDEDGLAIVKFDL